VRYPVAAASPTNRPKYALSWSGSSRAVVQRQDLDSSEVEILRPFVAGEDERSPTGQELRLPMRPLPWLETCERLRRASRFRHARQARTHAAQDHRAVFAPRRTCRVSREVGDCHGAAAVEGHALQLSIDEKGDALTVGGQEKLLGPLGAGKWHRDFLAEFSSDETAAREKHETLAIR
jgi:hypothetical protein